MKLEINTENKGKSFDERLKILEEETMKKMEIAHKIAKVFNKDFMDNLNNRF